MQWCCWTCFFCFPTMAQQLKQLLTLLTPVNGWMQSFRIFFLKVQDTIHGSLSSFEDWCSVAVLSKTMWFFTSITAINLCNWCQEPVISHPPSQFPRIKRNEIQIRLTEQHYWAPKGFKICHCSKDLPCNEKMEVGIFIYKYEIDEASLMVLAHK